MSDLYNRIYALCQDRGISIGKMCNELGISRGNLTELKMGRIKTLKPDNLTKISGFFGVTVDYLLGQETEKAPTQEGERAITDADIMFALWGDTTDVDEDDLDDVRRYAAFIRERKKKHDPPSGSVPDGKPGKH